MRGERGRADGGGKTLFVGGWNGVLAKGVVIRQDRTKGAVRKVISMMMGCFRNRLIACVTACWLSLGVATAAAAPTKAAASENVKSPKKNQGNKEGTDFLAAPKKGDSAKKSASKKGSDDSKSASKKGSDDSKRASKKGSDDSKSASKKGSDDSKSASKKGSVAAPGNDKGPRSVGAPNSGKVVGALKLHSSKALKVRQRSSVWGTPELVKLLQRAAGKVAKKHARSVLLVGDLSQKFGGPLVGHNSHQSGRDADVGFYVANSTGKPVPMTRFIAFDGTGKGTTVTWAQFDDARNWALISALLTDVESPAKYIFVSSPLRARILAYAEKTDAPKELKTKAASALMSPRDADVHDDHFHVRIACPERMKATCTEESVPRSGGAQAPSVAPKGVAAKSAAPNP